MDRSVQQPLGCTSLAAQGSRHRLPSDCTRATREMRSIRPLSRDCLTHRNTTMPCSTCGPILARQRQPSGSFVPVDAHHSDCALPLRFGRFLAAGPVASGDLSQGDSTRWPRSNRDPQIPRWVGDEPWEE
jgi:hypothetical protein